MKPTTQPRWMRFLSALVLLGGAAAFAGRPAGAQEAGPTPPAGAAEGDPTRAIKLTLEGELARRLGPADRWEIEVSASTADRETGRLPRVDIHAFNLRLPDGQVIAEIELTAEDLKIDLRQSLLVSSGKVHALIRLRPDDLANFIEQKAGGKVRNVRFAIR